MKDATTTTAVPLMDEESVPIMAWRNNDAAENKHKPRAARVIADYASLSLRRASYCSSDASLQEGPSSRHQSVFSSIVASLYEFAGAIPASVLLASLYLMMSVPFGSTYLSPTVPLGDTTRQALGMRLSLLTLSIGQLVLGGFGSDIDGVAVWQLGELSPFYHTFADVAAAAAHDETDKILPTTLYLMSSSTVLLGLTFYVFGYLGVAEVTYFFPSYVMLGLVGGVGLWMMLLSISLSCSPSRYPGGVASVLQGPFLVTLAFTAGLLLLRHAVGGKGKFVLLDPLYFLSIPLVFYTVLWSFGIDQDDAAEGGYLFKDPDAADLVVDGGTNNAEADQMLSPWSLYQAFDPNKVIMRTIFPASPTIIATCVMGIMLTAPFMPPLALFKGMDDYDMNREFCGHGWTNLLAGILTPGGLAVSQSYSASTVYGRAGGKGKLASVFVALINFIAFIYGQQIVEHIPRCMAGALVLDMGIALLLEGVVDPEKKNDPVEYASIWIIIITMTAFDMTAGLVAGLATSLVTHALQSYMGQEPVRTVRDASTLHSSKWRNPIAMKLLDDPVEGRSRIVIFLLQGHLFFGNMAKLRKQVFSYLQKKKEEGSAATIIILDFTLVVGIDSSAVAFIEKLRTQVRKKFRVSMTVFVSGPRRIRPSSAITERTLAHVEAPPSHVFPEDNDESEGGDEGDEDEEPHFQMLKDRSYSLMARGPYDVKDPTVSFDGKFFESLEVALSNCENALIAQQKPGLEKEHANRFSHFNLLEVTDPPSEECVVIRMLKEHCREDDEDVLRAMLRVCTRQIVKKGKVLWRHGEDVTSAKLILSGSVSAFVDENDPTQFNEVIQCGAFIGLRGLCLGEKHLATIRCKEKCVLYSMDLDGYNRLVQNAPKSAQVLNLAVARYLSHRLQHVSNKLYESRDLHT